VLVAYIQANWRAHSATGACRLWVSVGFVTAALTACSAEPKAASSPSGDAGAGVAPVSDADVTPSYCEVYPKFRKACGKGVLCESGFDRWCPTFEATSSKVASAAYVACAQPARCAERELKDCSYRRYVGARTSAQDALLNAVCTKCAPLDVAACKANNVGYEPSLGPDSVTDLFLAVWESSDAVASKMQVDCATEQLPAVDAGAAAGDASAKDAGAQSFDACLATFSQCAAGVYLDAIPECPK
jgi:hypothetical protein